MGTHRQRFTEAGRTALIVATLLATSGCSLLDDDDASSATPSTIVAARPVELAALEALLPQAADIGPGYVVVEGSLFGGSGDDGVDGSFGDLLETQMQEKCPDAFAIMSAEDGSASPDAVQREYTGPNGEDFGILLENDDAITDRTAFDAMIAAISLCETLTITEPETGLIMNVTFDAEPDDTYGDWGGIMRLQMSQIHPTFPAPVTAWYESHMFMVGSVGVTVTAADGVLPNSLEVMPRNSERMASMAASLEMTVAALQMEAAPEAATPPSVPT